MKKLVLAAAIASMLSGAAFAAVNLDANTGSGGVYANELIITTPTNLPTANTVDHTATATFGASFATDFVAYVRFDLPEGVKFTANPTYTVNDSLAAPAVISVAQGGAGQKYVIFAVAPSVVGANLVGSEVGTFVANGITIPAKQNVTLQYRLYETLTNAANQTLDLKNPGAVGFLSFVNALAITQGATVTRTADVAATGGAYRKFVGNSSTETLNGFTVTHTARALVSGVASTPAAILADTNSVTIAGSFVARTTVTLSSGGPVYTATATDTGATFTGITAANIANGSQWDVTYNVNGTTQIAASDYTGAIDLVGNAGYGPADGITGLASVVRNGTVLKAAFAEASAVAGTASAVSLTNTSSTAAPFTVRCLNSGAATVGTPGSVPANSSGRFAIVSALGCPAGVRGVELTFAVPTGSVIGSVVRQNLTTGVASFDGMVGNQ